MCFVLRYTPRTVIKTATAKYGTINIKKNELIQLGNTINAAPSSTLPVLLFIPSKSAMKPADNATNKSVISPFTHGRLNTNFKCHATAPINHKNHRPDLNVVPNPSKVLKSS